MNITTIAATYGRKHNLGDYNSANVEMTLWAQLEEGDDEAACAEALRDMARNHVMTELARIDRRLEAKVTDLFMGLPTEVRAPYTVTPPLSDLDKDLRDLDRKHDPDPEWADAAVL